MYERILFRIVYYEQSAAWKRSFVSIAVSRCRNFATAADNKPPESSRDENVAGNSNTENDFAAVLSDSERRQLVDRMIRVDHAGEFGADRIYAGQMAVLGKSSVGPIIKHMWEQEKHHLQTFERLVVKHRVRPTLLMPFWNIAGFALGAGTALLGKEGAMACTVAVEEVIGQHYNNQLRELL